MSPWHERRDVKSGRIVTSGSRASGAVLPALSANTQATAQGYVQTLKNLARTFPRGVEPEIALRDVLTQLGFVESNHVTWRYAGPTAPAVEAL